jgi:hypothetical protein
MDAQAIARMIAQDSARAERIAMVAKVERRKADRERTVSRRQARAVKFTAQGR